MYASDVLPYGGIEGLNALRYACGWDGTGDPPTVVILPDGRLATAIGSPPYPMSNAYGVGYALMPVTEDGDTNG